MDILGDYSLVCDASVSQTEYQETGEDTSGLCDVCGKGKILTNLDGVYVASALTSTGNITCREIT